MSPPPGAVLVLAVLLVVPGALLYRLFRPAGSRLECIALAPVLSLAFVWLLGEFSTVTGVPFAPIPYLTAVAVLAVPAGWRRARRPGPIERSNIPRRTALLLAGGIALSATSWVIGIQGHGTTPPYTDSVNHGLMAAQVSDRQSLDPAEVLGSDPSDRTPQRDETAYYPLAIHGTVAIAHRLGGIGFADGLLAVTFLFSAFVLPLGLFAAARTLVAASPTTAGLTALLGGTTGFFPLLPLSFGGLPLVVGLAMVPSVAMILVEHLSGRDTLAAAGLGALGSVAIVGTHTSELPLLAIIVGCTALALLMRHRVTIIRLLQRAAVAGVLFVVLVAPSLGSLAGGTSERSAIDEGHPTSIIGALVNLRGIVAQGGADFLALAAIVGVVVCLRRRWHTGLLAAAGCNLALFMIASCIQGPLRAVTVPWYQHPGRIALNFVLFIPFFAALGLVELAPAVARRCQPTRSVGDPAPALTIAVLLAVAGFAAGTSDLGILFRDRVVVGPDALAAFSYLKAHVQPKERVLNDANTDGSMWMYAFDGVVPLLGLTPAIHTESYTERLWLMTNLPSLGRDPRVAEYLQKYDVHYIYFDDRTFTQNPHHISGDALRTMGGLCEVFHRGTVHVYGITGSASCGSGV